MKAVGVVVKGFSNPFFIGMLTIIQKELEENNYIMLLRQVDPEENELDAAIALVKEKKPRGLIFLGGNFDQQREKFALLELPFIMSTISLKTGVDRSRFSSLTVDDYAEGYEITKYMIQSGHKKIAAIGFREDDRSISRLRLDGFLQAAKDYGAEVSAHSVAHAGEFTLKAGYEAAIGLLEKSSFTCLFCISDILALGAMRAIHDKGYRIPQDISVIGFDGIESGRYSIPSLTTVKQPDEEIAHQSVQILMNCLRKNKCTHKHLVFKAEFLDGESFAPLQP